MESSNYYAENLLAEFNHKSRTEYDDLGRFERMIHIPFGLNKQLAFTLFLELAEHSSATLAFMKYVYIHGRRVLMNELSINNYTSYIVNEQCCKSCSSIMDAIEQEHDICYANFVEDSVGDTNVELTPNMVQLNAQLGKNVRNETPVKIIDPLQRLIDDYNLDENDLLQKIVLDKERSNELLCLFKTKEYDAAIDHIHDANCTHIKMHSHKAFNAYYVSADGETAKIYNDTVHLEPICEVVKLNDSQFLFIGKNYIDGRTRIEHNLKYPTFWLRGHVDVNETIVILDLKNNSLKKIILPKTKRTEINDLSSFGRVNVSVDYTRINDDELMLSMNNSDKRIEQLYNLNKRDEFELMSTKTFRSFYGSWIENKPEKKKYDDRW